MSGGAYVEELERQFAAANELPYAIAVCNSKTALQLTLSGLDIGRGDEVIVPALGFAAAGETATIVGGAKLVSADIDLRTWCLDPASVARVTTERTRAIIAVHLFGNVADLEALQAIAEQAHATLIDSAIDVRLSPFGQRPAASVGGIGARASSATRADMTGDSGIVITADEELYGRLKYLRDHGVLRDKPDWATARHGLRLTNLQAAIACAQLQMLDKFRSERTRVHRSYSRLLKDVNGFREQLIPGTIDTALWARADRRAQGTGDLRSLEACRNDVIRRMKERGIETRPGFHAHCFLAPDERENLPNARSVAASAISLPAYPSLTDATIERICAVFRQSLREVLADP
jgi:perosamine synthetase